jgi:hypothetical protein
MFTKLASTVLALSLVHSAAATAASEPDLAAMRAATARFQDVKQALAEGYMRDPAGMCVTSSMMGANGVTGAMGIHYFRADLLGITQPPHPRVDGNGTHTDFLKPAILIYEPEADGSLQLVGVENLVFEKAWKEAGHQAPPSFHGVSYERMADDPATAADEAHGFEPHYDLHVWLYRDNPSGTFAPFNPKVSCSKAQDAAMPGGHDHMSGMQH